MFDSLERIAADRWGQGATIDWFLPSRASSPQARQLFARFERMAVSPSAFLRIVRMIREIDVRAVLPAIHVPTLVIQRSDDIMTPPCHGRYLASQISGARYFEQPGDHSLRFAASGDSDELIDEIEDFLTGAARRRDPHRVLATILLAETVDGTVVSTADAGDRRQAGDRRVTAQAQPAEILVSRTVKDLVVGSGISFADHGSHELTGTADRWPLFAVTGL